jgi:hypothetical protein
MRSKNGCTKNLSTRGSVYREEGDGMTDAIERIIAELRQYEGWLSDGYGYYLPHGPQPDEEWTEGEALRYIAEQLYRAATTTQAQCDGTRRALSAALGELTEARERIAELEAALAAIVKRLDGQFYSAYGAAVDQAELAIDRRRGVTNYERGE